MKMSVPVAVVSQALKSVGKLTDLFKESTKQKKWSAKRSVSGVMVTSAVVDMTTNGLTELNILLCFIAVLPLCFSVFQRR